MYQSIIESWVGEEERAKEDARALRIDFLRTRTKAVIDDLTAGVPGKKRRRAVMLAHVYGTEYLTRFPCGICCVFDKSERAFARHVRRVLSQHAR